MVLSAGLAGALAVRPRLLAQSGKVCAAVVIGVDKAGSLVKLKGAASGAQEFSDWLTGQGFETKLLTDATAPLGVSEVYSEVAKFINRGTLDQLVIYFAGHGFINNYSEFWMLSTAPDNPNEAISLRESIELARLAAVPNVVFISDACRSRTDSLGTQFVRGSLIFPNVSGTPQRPGDVDVFLATLIGDASFEVPVSTSAPQYQGIYTATFLSAFSNPDDTMVRTVKGVRVVPNNRLKDYLEREVRKRATRASIQLRQIPDTRVVSGDDWYIGKVNVAANSPTPAPSASSSPAPSASSSPAPSASSSPAPSPVQRATIQDVAQAELAKAGIPQVHARGLPRSAIEQAGRETGFEAASASIRRPVNLARLELESGFAVTGASVRAAWAHPSVNVEPRYGEDEERASIIEVQLSRKPAASVAIEFADGTGTVVAALNGFVGKIAVEDGRVVNVSYVPTPSNYRSHEYAENRSRIANLHAIVATAARFGVFRIEAGANREESGETLANKIRILKGVDPTLGLYAAYAYADAGVQDQVRSVREIMHGDLQVDLFDVAMLADKLRDKIADEVHSFPFCPMLSQGWNLLRVKDVRLPEDVVAARDHLRQALWTTFKPQGFELVSHALRDGRLR
jgi:hypothetical protein